MKLDEVSDLLAYISDTIPAGAYGPRALEGFYDGLKDLPGDTVMLAVQSLVKRKMYKITVAEIRDEVYNAMGIGDGGPEWVKIIDIIKRGPPYPVKPLENPVAQQALDSIGGLPALRLTERPDMVRKDFLEAYKQVRSRELGNPVTVLPILESGRGASGNVERTSGAIEAGAGDRGPHLTIPAELKRNTIDRTGRGG